MLPALSLLNKETAAQREGLRQLQTSLLPRILSYATHVHEMTPSSMAVWALPLLFRTVQDRVLRCDCLAVANFPNRFKARGVIPQQEREITVSFYTPNESIANVLRPEPKILLCTF